MNGFTIEEAVGVGLIRLLQGRIQVNIISWGFEGRRLHIFDYVTYAFLR